MHPPKIRRCYDPPEADDGQRILIDRLWPRGVRRQDLAADLWLKEIAPSNELRHWFGHDPTRWEEFRRRYFAELDANPEPLAKLRDRITIGPVTLLFAAKDEAHNNAVALRDYLAQ